MLNDLSVTDLAILAGTLIAVVHYFRWSTASRQPPAALSPVPPLSQHMLDEFVLRLARLETTVEGLPSLWQTEVARAKEQTQLTQRAAARLEQAERRAEDRSSRRDKEPDDGSLASPLRVSDGGRGGESLVPPMRPDVAPIDFGPPHKARR